jgi:hypothetical protein
MPRNKKGPRVRRPQVTEKERSNINTVANRVVESNPFDELSEQERIEYLLNPNTVKPHPGRPRKDGSTPIWKFFGFTRKQMFIWRRMAEIPQDKFDAYLAECSRKRKRASYRGILRLIENVPTENVIPDVVRRAAKALLRPAEIFLRRAVPPRRRCLVLRALHARLHELGSYLTNERRKT